MLFIFCFVFRILSEQIFHLTHHGWMMLQQHVKKWCLAFIALFDVTTCLTIFYLFIIANCFAFTSMIQSFCKFALIFSETHSLRENCPYSELFRSVFSRIRTEHGDIRIISSYSVRMRKSMDQNNSEYRHFLHSDSSPHKKKKGGEVCMFSCNHDVWMFDILNEHDCRQQFSC